MLERANIRNIHYYSVFMSRVYAYNKINQNVVNQTSQIIYTCKVSKFLRYIARHYNYTHRVHEASARYN